MFWKIAAIEGVYRGIERDVTTNNMSEKDLDNFLETYFSYLEWDYGDEEINETNLKKLFAFYKEFQSYDIPCEIIGYDSIPLEKVFGYTIELLGMDIVSDMGESLISDEVNPEVEDLLNANGLCKTKYDVETIIPLQNPGDVEWKPCYVYKLGRCDKNVKKL